MSKKDTLHFDTTEIARIEHHILKLSILLVLWVSMDTSFIGLFFTVPVFVIYILLVISFRLILPKSGIHC